MMNREQAIEIIKDIYPSKAQIAAGEYPEVAEALDLAIAALSTITQPNDALTMEGLFAIELERVKKEFSQEAKP